MTPDLKEGTCIDLKVCHTLRTLLENERHIQSVRVLLQKSLCGFDGTSPQVCCPEEKSDPVTDESLLTYNVGPLNNSTAQSVFPSKSTCGMSSVQSERIVGGRPADLGKPADRPAFGCAIKTYHPREMSFSQASGRGWSLSDTAEQIETILRPAGIAAAH